MRQNQVRQEEREPLRRQDTVAAVRRGIDGHFFVGSVTPRTLIGGGSWSAKGEAKTVVAGTSFKEVGCQEVGRFGLGRWLSQ